MHKSKAGIMLCGQLCLFPIFRAWCCENGRHRIFFSAHTQNKQLAYRDKMLAEFDQNSCVGFESHTPPLTRYIASPARKPERTRFHWLCKLETEAGSSLVLTMNANIADGIFIYSVPLMTLLIDICDALTLVIWDELHMFLRQYILSNIMFVSYHCVRS